MTHAALKPAVALTLLAAALIASRVEAAGFMLTEQSAGALGRAYAGVGIDGNDLSAAYYNPAGMTLIGGTALQAGFVGVGLNLDWAGNDGSKENGRLASQAIPHGYITHQINDSLWAGLSMTVPFGMGTDYDENWAHADKGISATVLTFDFNPSLAWKANEALSFGAGISIQYAEAELTTRTYLRNSSLAAANPTLGPALGDASVKSKIKADSLAWGWNVGMMFRPVENVRLGVSYRSKIKHDAKGDLTVSDPKNINPALSGIPGVSDKLNSMMGTSSGTAVINTPAWAMASAAWDINDVVSIYGSFRWTDWSSFDSLDIKHNGQTATKIQNGWKDTYLMSAGGDLHLTPSWTLKGGIAYETSPVGNPENRLAIIPDADRWWFAIGTSYKWNDNLTADLSFAHLHGVHERSLYENGEAIGKFRKLDAYLLGAQVMYRF